MKAFLFVCIACCMFSYVSAQNINPATLRQMQALSKDKSTWTPAQKKINSNILYTLKFRRNEGIAREVPLLRTDVVKEINGKIKVNISAVVTAQLLARLKNLGCEIIFSSERFGSITANIPLNKAEQIAALDAIKHIDTWIEPKHNDDGSDKTKKSNTPGKAGTVNRIDNTRTQLAGIFTKQPSPFRVIAEGAVASEADVTHKADIARSAFNVTGYGVKVGVLSNGVDGYEISQASGDLPPVIHILPGQQGSGAEGRAMMELVHDIAPGAELYYATAFTSDASFAQNILDLRAAGCDIIVDDVTYYNEGVFQDGIIAQAVNTVTASGALFFSSAGNSGNKNDNYAGAWEGDYVNSGTTVGNFAGFAHDFGGGATYTEVINDYTGVVTLKWSDVLGHASDDYDLYATNTAGAVIALSQDVQDGDDNPYESFAEIPPTSRIYIVLFSGQPRALHLNTNRGQTTISTPGVIYGHNAAASAYTVAATPAAAPISFIPESPTGPYPDPFNASNKVERFSSDGPRRIFFNPDGTEITPGNILFNTNGGLLLPKVDITAADGVMTNTPGFAPFFGTSAAAPNAAAIAALIKSKFPAATPAQIRAALTQSAIDIEAPGADRDAGAGIVMAYEALQYFKDTYTNCAPVSVASVSTIQPSCPFVFTGTITVDAGSSAALEYSIDGVNYQPSNTFSGLAAGSYYVTIRVQGEPNCLEYYSGNPVAINTIVPTTTNTATFSYTGPAMPIPDANASGISIPVTVSGLDTIITDINFHFNADPNGTCDAAAGNPSASVDHSYISDLTFTLTSPGGKTVTLIKNTGSSGNNFCTVLLDDDGGYPSIQGLTSADAPVTGNFAPFSLLSAFDGENPNGTWILNVSDNALIDEGSVRRFSLEISAGTICPVVPAILATGTFAQFTACENSPSAAQSFTVQGAYLTENLTVTAAAGFEVSLSSGGGFAGSTALTPVSGTVPATTIYVRKAAGAAGTVTDAVVGCSSAGAPTQELLVSSVTNPLITWYADADQDGYGDDNTATAACDAPPGYISTGGDCDDTDDDVHPGAAEICDGVDNNCNGVTDENCNVNVYIRIADNAKTEGRNPRNMRFIIKLNKRPLQAVQVNYTTQNITAVAGSDYVAQAGTLTFAPGVKRQRIDITINGDRTAEPDETFRILLSNAVNATIVRGNAVGTIINDDGTALTAVTTASTASENAGKTLKVLPNPATALLFVQLSGYAGNVTLQLRSLDGKVLQQQKLQALGKTAQHTMNVSQLAGGIYMLTAIDEKGNAQTAKVIVAR